MQKYSCDLVKLLGINPKQGENCQPEDADSNIIQGTQTLAITSGEQGGGKGIDSEPGKPEYRSHFYYLLVADPCTVMSELITVIICLIGLFQD